MIVETANYTEIVSEPYIHPVVITLKIYTSNQFNLFHFILYNTVIYDVFSFVSNPILV